MLARLQRAWWRRCLKDESFAGLFEDYDGDEFVTSTVRPTGLDCAQGRDPYAFRVGRRHPRQG
jgi:hypothetical protein